MGGLDGAKQLADRLCQCFNGCSRCLLDKQLAALCVLKGKQHQIHRAFQAHHKPGHVWIGDGNGFPLPNLLNKQRYHRASGAHHISIASNGNGGAAFTAPNGHCRFFHQRFGHAHCIDGVHRFVGRKANHFFDTALNGRVQHVLCSKDIGADCLHGEKLARRHLFKGCGVENIVHPLHSAAYAGIISCVADKELQLFASIILTHIVLFFLITAEDTNLSNIRL